MTPRRRRRHRSHPDDPRLEEILRESRSVSDRLESVTARLEEAVERLAAEISRTPDGPESPADA